jgi:hypothetical protein
LILAAPACLAQTNWHLGIVGGHAMYSGGTIFSPAGRAEVGVRDRFVIGVALSEDMYEHLSGELRYTYQDGDPFIEARGAQVNVQGQSHTINYDLLIHFRHRGHRVRPYVAAGAGAKLYRVSGPPPMVQPFPDIAVLTTRDNWTPVVSLGAGVKVRVHPRMVAGFDFRDFVSTFPTRLFVPAPFGSTRGYFHQFTPMVTLSYVF